MKEYDGYPNLYDWLDAHETPLSELRLTDVPDYRFPSSYNSVTVDLEFGLNEMNEVLKAFDKEIE